MIDGVLVKALWADPEEVVDFCNCANSSMNDCSKLSEQFPIDSELVHPMYELVLQMIYQAQGFPQDNLSDARAVETIEAKEPNEQT